MADPPACAVRLIASKPVGIGMPCWSNKPCRPRRSSRSLCPPISLTGTSRSLRTPYASRPVGRSMSDAIANWRSLASNLLILLALLHDCRLICGENLTTLKTEGRGRGVQGRWRNWRNNTTVRGELWRVLKYKCHLFGIRARQVEPRGTTHTCPHCGQPANTYASPAPANRKKAIKWGAWLCCRNPECWWNGSRDYAASLNIARLGLAFLCTYHDTQRYQSYRIRFRGSQASFIHWGWRDAVLPSQGITPRPQEGKYICYAGWSFSTSLRTSQPKRLLSVLSTSELRKRLLSGGNVPIVWYFCNGVQTCSGGIDTSPWLRSWGI